MHFHFSANCSQLQLNYIAETSNVFSTEIESQRRLVLCRITETFISVHLKQNAFNCKSPQIIKAEHFQMYHTKTTQNQQNIKHQTQNFKNAKPHYKELQTYHNHAACKVKLQFPPLQIYKYTQIYKHRNIQLQNTQIHNILHCTVCTSLRMHLGCTLAELQLAPLQKYTNTQNTHKYTNIQTDKYKNTQIHKITHRTQNALGLHFSEIAIGSTADPCNVVNFIHSTR